ncbi:laccase domain-containing protein [Streptomyces sp. S6]|nr:laccase domain-containing protein [Streptomyces sp. S6]
MIVRHPADSVTGSAHFAFTDRWGGVSAAPYGELNLGARSVRPRAVGANRERAARRLGLDPASVVWMNQVHGRDVAVVDGPWGPERGDPGRGRAGDHAARSALAVLTADCTPVLLVDPAAGVVGAAHAGRPGLVAGVVPAVVEAMTALGARPSRITARTGPAVCGRCYEVPEEMRAEVAEAVPGTWAETSWGTPAVDVTGGVHAQLAALGVSDLHRSPVCTRESGDHFSYRRERTTGRLAGYVWLD